MLIAAWNAEATIEGTVRSALPDDAPDVEVIVVDDGSTDSTAAIVGRIAAVDDRLRLEVLPGNRGASAARNRGLELVRTDWLTIVDADDRLTPGGLRRLQMGAALADVRAVIGQQFWTDGHHRWISRLYDNPDVRRAGRKSLTGNPGLMYFVSPHAKLIHRSCWEGLGFEGPFFGDQAWVIRSLMRAGDRIQVLADDVYEWHRPPAGDQHASITARARSTARNGPQMAALARVSFDAVATEAAGLDEGVRRGLLVAYLERLLRYDLAPFLNQAIDRRDPATSDIIDAIGGLIASTPPDVLRSTRSLGRDALGPPLRRWHELDSAARAAFHRLVAVTRDAVPGSTPGAGDAGHRIAFALAFHLPTALGPRLAEPVLDAALIAGRLWRRVRLGLTGRAAH